MLDLYQLRTFLAAARALSFTRAAEALLVSPPAVSQSVALLERSAGRQLFHRLGRRVTLTAEGSALKAHAEKIFDEVEGAARELSGKEGGPAELRVAIREMVTHYLLPSVLRSIERRYPGTRLGLHELEPRPMLEALLSDRIDFGYYYAPIPNDGLTSAFLGRMSSHIYASRGLLRRLGRPRTAKQTLRLPFVAPRQFEGDPASPSPDGFPDHRLRRDIRYRAELLETHRRLALQGLCAAVLPDGVVKEERKRRRLIRLPGPRLGRELYFFKRKGRNLPAVAGEINAGLKRALARWG